MNINLIQLTLIIFGLLFGIYCLNYVSCDNWEQKEISCIDERGNKFVDEMCEETYCAGEGGVVRLYKSFMEIFK